MPNPTTWIQYVYRLGLILKELKLTPEQFLDALKKKPDEIGIELDVIHSLAYVTPCEGLIQAAGSVNDHLPSQITVDSCIEKQLAQSSIRRVSLRLILWVWMFTH